LLAAATMRAIWVHLRYARRVAHDPFQMVSSIGFRMFSFLPSCYSSYGAWTLAPVGLSPTVHAAFLCQPSLDAHISVLILGEADKPQNRRQFRINYELILSEILFLTADRRGSLVRNGDYASRWQFSILRLLTK
jgi:hypothetical protein